MRHPLRKDRPWFLGPSACACLGFLAAAWANLRLRPVSFSEAPLEAIELGLHVLLCLGAAALFGWLAVGIARGPSRHPPKSVGSGEWGALFGLGLAGIFCDAMALRMGIELWAGRAEHPIALAVVLLFTGSLGALLTLCAPLTLWQVLRRGTSRVILPDVPVIAGAPLEVVLEVPFPPERAPELEATLSVVRAWSEGAGDSGTSHEATLWCETTSVSGWIAAGAKRSRAPLRFDLPGGVPCDPGSGVDYFWRLQARSTTAGRPFSGTYLLPIAFSDPIEEGIIARA